MNLKSLFYFLENIFHSPQNISIYTDGSHKGKWGAWAFVVIKNNKIIFECVGREQKTDSHRMEFQAAIEALKYLKPSTPACIYSDSRVLIGAVTHAKKRPRSNQDQLEELDQLIKAHSVSWKWVRAHAGNIHNERCDQLCIQAREGTLSTKI